MKTTYKAILLALAGLLVQPACARAADNHLTNEEKAQGFQMLFNGKDLTGWKRTSKGFGAWKADNGELKLAGEGGGMIYAEKEYDNFILKVDFKMTKDCNSGVFLRVGDPKDEVQTGIEVQVQDDFGKKPTRNTAGSLYDLVAPTENTIKAAGEWNTFVITCDKNRITVEMNGKKVAETDLDKWDKPGERPDGTKHKFKMALKDFPRKGLIGFQDHGHEISYKNIKLRELK